MEFIGELFRNIFGLIGEIWSKLIPILGTVLSFLLWVLVAIIVLPCVYIAGNIYPLWEKWGEKF